MRIHARHRAARRKRRRSGRKAGTLVFLLLCAGTGWIIWKAGYAEPVWKFVQSRFVRGPAPEGEETNDSRPGGDSSRTSRAAAWVPSETNQRSPQGQEQPASGEGRGIAELESASVLEAQIALDRLAISPGSIDGVLGFQSRVAVRAFQMRTGLPETGELDATTLARLRLAGSTLIHQRVEAADLSRLLPVASTWLGKSEQERLDFETVLELLAERSHAHPSLIRRLNPGIDFSILGPGAAVLVPATRREFTKSKAAFIRIRLGERTVQAFDHEKRLLAHFPCSIAQRIEKRPVGELRVAVLAPNPDYTFNPDIFPESAEARELGRKLRLPPGPNNPVGTVWIGLDRPGYGIHGTPKPEDVGRTESHGCFRLANWNAEYLLHLVSVGTPVHVEP